MDEILLDSITDNFLREKAKKILSDKEKELLKSNRVEEFVDDPDIERWVTIKGRRIPIRTSLGGKPDFGGKEDVGKKLEGYSPSAKVDLDGKIYTDNVEDAVKALYENRKVSLSQPKQVSTLLTRLQEEVRTAEAKGQKADKFDLCNVSVKGTNIFCVDTKGIPRLKMPQLKGVPTAGSLASKLTPDSRGEVDLTDSFVKHLGTKGYKITSGFERADFLRATQNELNGVKVAGIANAIRQNKLDEQSIIISNENYIVDGHHRWAATVAVDYDDNKPGDLKMPIKRIGVNVIDLLKEADDFTTKQGLAHQQFIKKCNCDL